MQIQQAEFLYCAFRKALPSKPDRWIASVTLTRQRGERMEAKLMNSAGVYRIGMLPFSPALSFETAN
ncbi:hypothetical protein AGABI1DRAFT_81585 [Agaricus bisporus var. burnettii JB137-S8]|uniref:Uncharacterized protein n=1 Tax=Agaricus bisporus var. burnettii (strain JB137-S8 / ATCC MYA-4627 / FGSC 10392) TaxID=597362 RepID=K5XK01_AGABU|nr:hypothetical protein AGABI2DRAFT_133061 [Agaricus bisporus var. bisporus H97]XP_007325281.1 uncharacterized protein AGABI1DRAFT_81585 [Agaricus bisporus var. burnettii JB137-S8]EKM83858.1 hypothetical protein AGABI1DRAFT_81585 [Agaricus bisporus var. burnettii JB137-S8]EKV51382.1 hypothetical protein AGABI2DRAFT_133061 [Agaricus bisporus var. bisporus H97]